MQYSYTQISQYLSCPRRYRYRYLDGWRQKETSAAMMFGRAFETALFAYFGREDSGAALFQTWSKCREQGLEFRRGETWDQMLYQGISLLNLFAQDARVTIADPKRSLQVPLCKRLPGGSEFIGYVDALGQLDGTSAVIDWKTTSVRYPEQPAGLLMLDPQLVCYSWLTGMPDVAFVVFVRKHRAEIQYLRATISEAQREDFGRLVADAIEGIERGHFPLHSGIRFPQNPCLSCGFLGLCLNDEARIAQQLIRPGEDLDWIGQLCE